MNKFNQKGVTQLLVLIILLLGIVAAVYLAQKPAIFKPKAAEPIPDSKSNLLEKPPELPKGISCDNDQDCYSGLLCKEHLCKPNSATSSVKSFRPLASSPLKSPTEVPNKVISSCGEITSEGNYSLNSDITTDEKICLNIHDTNNVYINCDGHSITTSINSVDPNLVKFENVQNFAFNSCNVYSQRFDGSVPFVALRTSNGSVTDNTLGSGDSNYQVQIVGLDLSENVLFENNLVYLSSLHADLSHNITINRNNITANRGKRSMLISLQHGGENKITNNTIDGLYNNEPWPPFPNAADDGIVLFFENNDLVQDNTISNTFDAGIETVGLITNTQIIGNKIKNAGYTGIGSWYYTSWQNNTVANNTVDDAPTLFYFNRTNGLTDAEQFLYFQGNTFKNNTFTNQKSNFIDHYYSAYFDLKYIYRNGIGGRFIQDSDKILGSNLFSYNDLGGKPYLISPENLFTVITPSPSPSPSSSIKPSSCDPKKFNKKTWASLGVSCDSGKQGYEGEKWTCQDSIVFKKYKKNEKVCGAIKKALSSYELLQSNSEE